MLLNRYVIWVRLRVILVFNSVGVCFFQNVDFGRAHKLRPFFLCAVYVDSSDIVKQDNEPVITNLVNLSAPNTEYQVSLHVDISRTLRPNSVSGETPLHEGPIPIFSP